MPHTKQQKGGAVLNAIAELAHAKLSNNYLYVRTTYTRCTHVVMLLAMQSVVGVMSCRQCQVK